MYKEKIKCFFDNNYNSEEHYWWKSDNRYSIDEYKHTPYYAKIISEAKKQEVGLL